MAGTELKRRAVNAQDILNKFYDLEPFAIIFLLDCCRTYHLPNPELATRSLNANHSTPSGPKLMQQAGSLIAFACGPGTEAKDGKGQRNGLFTKHLLQYLPTPHKDIEKVLRKVINEVMEESNSSQIPFYTASLRHDNICLCDPKSR